MKKTMIGSSLAVLSIVFLLFFGVNGVAFAESIYENECDRVFYETVNELIAENGGETITAEKTLLYNIDLKPAAMLYDFRIGQKQGFCVIGSDDGKYVPFEIFPAGENPYLDIIGLPIYLAQTMYAEYRKDGLYYIDGIGVTKEAILQQFAPYYGIDYGFPTTNSSISYVSKTINEYVNAKKIPSYSDFGLSAACAPLAAANIVTYFDRYATELIPNYTPGNAMGSNYLYKAQNDTINQLIYTLYVKMGTMETGTTSNQFISGLNSYCFGQGYYVSYENILSGGSLNYSAAQTALHAKKALVLFETRFSVSTISYLGNSTNYITMTGTANHVMAAFGYHEITYSFSDGSTSTERFLVTATGLGGMMNAYLNVNKNLTLNEAYAINIL